MTDKYSLKIAVVSFYALAIAIFVSVSLLSVYHLLTIIAFILLLNHKEIDFKKLPASSWALLAFVGTQLLSAAVNFSELEDKSRSIGAIKYPLIGIVGALIYQNQKLQQSEFFKKHSKIAFNIFSITIISAFIYSLFKVHSGWVFFKDDLEDMVDGKANTRLGGFTDIMRYGYGSAVVLLVLLTTYLNIKKFPTLNKKFLLTTIIIGFSGLFLSYTRGAMLGFLIGLPVVFFYFNRKITALIGLASVAMIGIMIGVSLMGGSESSRFLMKSNSVSNNVRMSQYLSAIHAFKEKPVFGFGPQQLKFHVKEIKQKYNLEYPDYSEHAHNVYLELAANTGIVGLLAFLTWLALWFKELFYIRNHLAKQMFFPVILFMLIAGQFEMLLMAQTSALIYFLYAISHCTIFKKEA